MYPVTCGDLVRRVRQRANLETTTGTVTLGPSFMPDTEVIDNINTSIGFWYDMVIGSRFAGQLVRAPWNITTQQGVQSYALAPNFYEAISVDCYIVGSVTPISADPYQEEQRNLWTTLTFTGWVYGQPLLYQLQGNNICFRPIPQGSQQVTINYYPTPPVLNDANDIMDSVGGWEEWVVLDAAIKCAVKDGQLDLVQVLSGLKAEQTERIKAAAPNRDAGAPERIHVTRGLEWSDDDGFTGWGF